MKVGINTNLAFLFKYHSFLFLTERVFKKFNWNVTYVNNLNHNLISYANNLYNSLTNQPNFIQETIVNITRFLFRIAFLKNTETLQH